MRLIYFKSMFHSYSNQSIALYHQSVGGLYMNGLLILSWIIFLNGKDSESAELLQSIMLILTLVTIKLPKSDYKCNTLIRGINLILTLKPPE